ncbi:hypothetical protein LZ32DRAFT_278387 [Colletotrichum eremochloae]|nr:hypothetical protein LZ32DRAFT_278387 [Colletotrichum eremochloae]
MSLLERTKEETDSGLGSQPDADPINQSRRPPRNEGREGLTCTLLYRYSSKVTSVPCSLPFLGPACSARLSREESNPIFGLGDGTHCAVDLTSFQWPHLRTLRPGLSLFSHFGSRPRLGGGGGGDPRRCAFPSSSSRCVTLRATALTTYLSSQSPILIHTGLTLSPFRVKPGRKITSP